MSLAARYTICLQEDESNVARLHLRAAPVEQVVVEFAVASAELELLQHLLVLHHIQRVEHVEASL